MPSQAEENYLKAIFKLSGKEQHSVSTNSIAEELQTKASSVSDMVKKVIRKKFSKLYKVPRCFAYKRRCGFSCSYSS